MNVSWNLVFSFVLLSSMSFSASATTKNGFFLGNALVPSSQVFQGGPPRDGIPAIDTPVFINAREAGYLKPDDRVLGIVLNGVAKAYPVSIMNWHEIVNDTFDRQNIVVTFCPLCGTGMAFNAVSQGQKLTFGVSGLLYQSDVLLYDRETESLWSQVMAKAVSGEMKGRHLEQIVMAHTNWEDWKSRHPDSLVLGRETGYLRDYARNPYKSYGASKRLYFDVNHRAPEVYHPKEEVMGIKIGGKTKAYPFQELSIQGKAEFSDTFGGETLRIIWNERARSAEIRDSAGRVLPTTIAFWFAWYTFHPNTEVFKAPQLLAD